MAIKNVRLVRRVAHTHTHTEARVLYSGPSTHFVVRRPLVLDKLEDSNNMWQVSVKGVWQRGKERERERKREHPLGSAALFS